VNVADALADSCLASLPADVVERLLLDANVVEHSRGTVVRRSGDPASTQAPGLVVEGLLRVFQRDATGREATARYVDTGDLIGLAALLDPTGYALPPGLDAEAVHHTVVVEFSLDNFRHALDDEASLGVAISRYLFHELLAAQHALAGSVLLPVRSRVAAHLLDLAERRGHDLIVVVSSQQLAAAVGSVREVVSRAVRELEDLRLVRRQDDHIVLLDSAGLHRLAAQ
jgi:CRP/FNR family transcriptional regulator, cyclic AMP receptor protein